MIGLLDRPNWKISVDALIVNSEGQLLLVRPTYKPGLDLPGGILMDGECPVDGLKRELREELGIEIDVGDLRCVDYIPSDWERRPVIMMLLDCTIEDGNPSADMEEVDQWLYLPVRAALKEVSMNIQARLDRVFFDGKVFDCSARS